MSDNQALILTENRGDICWMTINRPGDRNSINSPLMREIERVIVETEKTSARAMVFTGAGNTFFCGGADAVEMMRYDAQGARDFSERIQNLFNRMEASPLIMVAAINGLSYGGGFELALACDFRIAADSARVGLPEVRVGIIPGGGGTQRLTKIVGKGKAMEAILTGRLYSAQEALNIGMIHKVAPKEELDATVEEWLKPVFRNPQYALSRAKKAVQLSQDQGLFDGLETERKEFKECFKEGFFVEEVRRQIETGIMPTT